MDRRSFLEKSISAMVLVYLQGCTSTAKNLSTRQLNAGYILSGHGLEAPVRTTDNYFINTPQNETGLMIVSLKDRSSFFLPAPCKGHEIVLHPLNPNIVFVPSKWGQDAYLADYREKKLIKTFKTDRSSLLFFGHAVYSTDGSLIYCSMNDHHSKKGFISVRNSSTLEELYQIDSRGLEPHQVRWHIEDRVLSVMNDRTGLLRSADNTSTLNFIDVASKELLNSISFKQDRYAHFTTIKNTGVACRSSGKSSSAKLMEYFDLDKRTTTFLDFDFSPSNEALSHVLIPSKGIAIVTVINNKLVIWDYIKNKPLHILDMPTSPRGVTLAPDEKSVFVTFLHNDHAIVKQYDTATLLKGETIELLTLKAGSGSHLTMVYE